MCSEWEKIYTHPRGQHLLTPARGSLNATRYGFVAFQATVGSVTADFAASEGINEVPP